MNDETWYVQYIGKKPVARDVLYGTGTQWQGHGDIRPVAWQDAVRLLGHTDAFRRATAEEYAALLEANEPDESTSAEHEIELARARERVAARGSTTQPQGDQPPSGGGDSGGDKDAEQTGDGQGGDPGEQESGESETPPAHQTGPKFPKAPSQMTKKDCQAYASEHFNLDLDDTVLDREAMLQVCTNLRDFGQPEAPQGA